MSGILNGWLRQPLLVPLGERPSDVEPHRRYQPRCYYLFTGHSSVWVSLLIAVTAAPIHSRCHVKRSSPLCFAIFARLQPLQSIFHLWESQLTRLTNDSISHSGGCRYVFSQGNEEEVRAHFSGIKHATIRRNITSMRGVALPMSSQKLSCDALIHVFWTNQQGD